MQIFDMADKQYIDETNEAHIEAEEDLKDYMAKSVKDKKEQELKRRLKNE